MNPVARLALQSAQRRKVTNGPLHSDLLLESLSEMAHLHLLRSPERFAPEQRGYFFC
jgi:hypothetical protein